MSASISGKQAKARDLRQRVLTCLYKLSDRDTHSAAALELESIAKTVTGDSILPFISSIVATDSADKSPVRRQCIRLISVLSENHGNSLSPYLSKLLTAVVRRLRDTDSSVRAACVAACLSLSSSVTSHVFTTLSKPFLESLFTEQDTNAQTGAALCLAAIIEGSSNPDAGSLRRLLPKLEKLAKSASFKAKAALLALIGSIVDVKGVLSDGGKNVVRNLIVLLVEFLSSADWAARKAAAEALMKMAAMEKDALSEYKIQCLKSFEAKRFDKVKATRQVINQMIEAWNQIPDLPESVDSTPLALRGSETSSKEHTSNGHYKSGSKPVCSVGPTTNPQAGKRNFVDSPASKKLSAGGSSASTAKRRSSLYGDENKLGRAMFQKLERKKPVDMKVEIVSPSGSCGMVICDDSSSKENEGKEEQLGNSETKCGKNNGKQKLFRGGGSRLISRGDARVVAVEAGDPSCSRGESEELNEIRKQLLQIENQQSDLLNLLQGFIGSSQNGMQALETRVHSLELALDELSFDLAVSTGRLSLNKTPRSLCWHLPGSKYFSSKLWRKAGVRSTSQLSAPIETTPAAAVGRISIRNGDGPGNQRQIA